MLHIETTIPLGTGLLCKGGQIFGCCRGEAQQRSQLAGRGDQRVVTTSAEGGSFRGEAAAAQGFRGLGSERGPSLEGLLCDPTGLHYGPPQDSV